MSSISKFHGAMNFIMSASDEEWRAFMVKYNAHKKAQKNTKVDLQTATNTQRLQRSSK